MMQSQREERFFKTSSLSRGSAGVQDFIFEKVLEKSHLGAKNRVGTAQRVGNNLPSLGPRLMVQILGC